MSFDAERVFLIGEHERVVLHSRLHGLVAPLFDGKRRLSDIADELRGRVTDAEVLFVALALERKGYLTTAIGSADAAADAFWQALGSKTELTSERLRGHAVSVVSANGESTDALCEALFAAGVRVVAQASTQLVVTSSYLEPRLAEINRDALVEGRRWMPVNPLGLTPWFGPMFAPGTACWECLADRVRLNRPLETFLARSLGEANVAAPLGALPATATVGRHFAALLAAWWVADEGGRIDGNLVVWDWRQLCVESHPVQRRPQCSACGDPSLFSRRSMEPLVLQSRPRVTVDGGFRVATPEATYQRLRHLISPITGLVAEIRPAETRDHALRPVYVGSYPVSPALGTPNFDAFSRLSMGKGRSAAQSRTSALCEALERQSARFFGDEMRRSATFAEIREEAIDPRSLQNFSETQYRTRDQWNASHGEGNTAVPVPFDEQVAIDWSPAWSLTNERIVWVPTTYCFRDAPSASAERFCHFNPNGHAAGTSLEDAVLQGFLELVERDAVALWWYNGARRPGVDLASFADPYFDTLLAHYRELGWSLWALDLTTDLGLPVFAALAQRDGSLRYAIGFGCHVNAAIALERALTELNQLFDPTLGSPEPFAASALPDRAMLHPSDSHPQRRRSNFATSALWDIRDEVLRCVGLANAAGLETLVLDQTRPDIGLAAAKVIVPGLRHFWPRFGPGRLYDVPVRLGWVSRPTRESDLTPIHLFL